MSKEKIQFVDRDDLIKKLDAERILVKKSDIHKDNILAGLQDAIKRSKRGDKHAIKEIVKLRKKMLQLSSETYIELEEDQLFSATIAQLEVVEEIDTDE